MIPTHIFNSADLEGSSYYVDRPDFWKMIETYGRFPQWVQRDESDYYYTLIDQDVFCITASANQTWARVERLTNVADGALLLVSLSGTDEIARLFTKLPEMLMEYVL